MRKLSFFLLFIVAASSLYAYEPISGDIHGTITDTKGNPLEYVRVTIHDIGVSTTTDAKGLYRLSNISSGEYLVTFVLTGYESKSLNINVRENDSFKKEWDVSLEESLIETSVIDVTSSFNAVDISKSTLSITELSARTLSKDKTENLAESIENVPGLSNVSTGPGIGKPVIRGLSSQSVLIIHDGVKHESQMWGDEHGPELSLFDIERIEILRGPASLMFGADGLGGVVNIISKPLDFSGSKKTLLYGEALLGTFSVNNQFLGGLTLGIGSKSVGLKGHFGYRKSGDLKTPDGTLTVNTLDGTNTINGGTLFNSSNKELEGGANLGLKGQTWNINAGFELFNREIQMHDDPAENPDGTPNQKLNTTQSDVDGSFNLSKKLKLETILSFQTQIRKEFETNEDRSAHIAALHLDMKTYNGELKLQHMISKKVSGTFGVSGSYQTNQSLAEEKLIPNYNSNTIGVYLFEKYSEKKVSFSIGARFDTKKLNIENTVFESDSLGNPTKELTPQSLSFNALSGSAGISYSANKWLNIYGNIGRGWRPPSEFELFVDGVHEGTGRYEKGLKTLDTNAEPKPEESINMDLGIRINSKYVNIQVSAYRNRINNFVYPSPTTDTIDGFPVYNVMQDKSTFVGYEYSVQLQPAKWVIISANGDFVNTKNEATGNPLPLTPPMKNIVELKLQKKSFGYLLNPYIRFTGKFVSAQNNVDPLEAKTNSYSLVGIGTGFDFIVAKSVASIDISVDNLFDTKYVDHLNRFKSYAMNPGRSINVQLNVPFKF